MYQEFINEAIIELNSYQKNCNPNHEMLVLFSDECKFKDSHMHGGFKCGKDSNWNKTDCKPVYCDSGYIYNTISNSCIKFPNEKDNKTLIIIISIACSVFVLALIITIIVLYKKKVLCFKKNSAKNDSISNDNLVPETNY